MKLMEINEFARISFERQKKNDPDNRFNWEYNVIGMGGECGELLNKLKKIKRGDFTLNKDEVAEEVADVITYAFLVLMEIGVDPEKAIMKKFEEVNKRIEMGGFHMRVPKSDEV
jgi:NTP pyrophosphatase (non-canonical NTP hydrolase)